MTTSPIQYTDITTNDQGVTTWNTGLVNQNGDRLLVCETNSNISDCPTSNGYMVCLESTLPCGSTVTASKVFFPVRCAASLNDALECANDGDDFPGFYRTVDTAKTCIIF